MNHAHAFVVHCLLYRMANSGWTRTLYLSHWGSSLALWQITAIDRLPSAYFWDALYIAVGQRNAPRNLPWVGQESISRPLARWRQSPCTHFDLPLCRPRHRALDKHLTPNDALYGMEGIRALVIWGKEGKCTFMIFVWCFVSWLTITASRKQGMSP